MGCYIWHSLVVLEYMLTTWINAQHSERLVIFIYTKKTNLLVWQTVVVVVVDADYDKVAL